ncbi:hypothetical protein [Zestomonas carbonaria]|uniref:Outer membrane lipoprotein SlyB n=1 Tax=Zestomonas carbonaria TaxID=2762745 RepID=A0A7U7ETQ7_9GAMM|nr:hypothetical protein [Pseudomonas carbonaria]CAD5110495.1 hypothetical protein PSEWESI4_04818 [Pseudomonas carbonaria]
MNRLSSLALCFGLLASQVALADQVIREVPDTTAGKGVGALSGLMLGAAAGGPIGGLVGAGAGFWLGGSAQQAGGLDERAYEVENDVGERSVVRSPNARFSAGEAVTRKGTRIVSSAAEEPLHVER